MLISTPVLGGRTMAEYLVFILLILVLGLKGKNRETWKEDHSEINHFQVIFRFFA